MVQHPNGNAKIFPFRFDPGGEPKDIETGPWSSPGDAIVVTLDERYGGDPTFAFQHSSL